MKPIIKEQFIEAEELYKIFYAPNGKQIGDIKYYGDLVCVETGEWVFWPKLGGGYWPEHLLFAICGRLTELNEAEREKGRAKKAQSEITSCNLP